MFGSACRMLLSPTFVAGSLLIGGAFAFAQGGGGGASGIPRPEHPRPDMLRAEWLNLNGVWEFADTDDMNADAKYLAGDAYPDKIAVPFARETKLSGLARTGLIKNVWYRRSFRLPDGWKSPRTLLHVCASDFRSRVWINGQLMGEYTGGNSPFAFDITKALKPGDNQVIIHVFDDTRSGLQPTGKQSHGKSEGCVYTRTTGIWQTVWLEGVGASYIKRFAVTPDPDKGRIEIAAVVDDAGDDLALEAVALADGKEVGKVAGGPAKGKFSLEFPLSSKRLWSPEDPFLYDLKLTLKRGNDVIDTVSGYFGLRNVTIKGRAILINGKAIFQRTVLDQGFYPDGVWTAPSDDELKKDIERSMAAGFNGARLHQKVFEPRFLYWADKLGYLVWGEYPNWGMRHNEPQVRDLMIKEWETIVHRDFNHPAIIGWCPFNETGGEAGFVQQPVFELTRALDATRPVIESSGYAHTVPNPMILDAHDYDGNVEKFRERWMDRMTRGAGSQDLPPMPARYGGSGVAGGGNAQMTQVPFFVSEFGGIGWATEGGWGYGQGPKTLDEFYARFESLCNAQLDNRFLFGYCYTQLTDIEQEKNGVYYYDRRPKFDLARLKKIQSRKAAYEENPPIEEIKKTAAPVPKGDWKVLTGAAPDGNLAKPWKYVMETKPADNWKEAAFDDSQWKSAPAPFGNGKNGVRTKWDGKDIWLRQEIAYDGKPFDAAMLVTHYDNDTEVYVNGQQVWKRGGWNDAYEPFNVSSAVKKALKPGKNLIAIHTWQDAGGQYIDAALLLLDPAK
ncbi:MAG: beta galactosidase jelly roll domain-containing protein [Candidatus Sumerlaeota bacterium]|nr:beta galactosidase jelly roll domain-containing protein [Candidatus Sumerlaeota bacterium]